jgi:hypothetical protein
LVIVEGGTERKYVGMVSPRALREALTTQFSELEVTYQSVQDKAQIHPGVQLFPADQIDEIVEQWTISQFDRNGVIFREEDLKILVSSQVLSNLLETGGGKMETDYLKWDGGPDSALLNYLLVCRSSPYVALVREKRLEKVVDRIDLAARVAESALKRQLS